MICVVCNKAPAFIKKVQQCQRCYNRLRMRAARATDGKRTAFRARQLSRVLAKVQVKGPGECWNWTGTVFGPAKYPHIRYPRCTGYDPLDAPQSRHTTPYRLVYLQMVGPIPAGMCIDHICFNPLCCNPSHLRVLTVSANAARKSPAWYQAQREYQQRRSKKAHSFPQERAMTHLAASGCETNPLQDTPKLPAARRQPNGGSNV